MLIFFSLEATMDNTEDCYNKNLLATDYGYSAANSQTTAAIDESRRIAHDPSVASYSTIQSLREALDQ